MFPYSLKAPPPLSLNFPKAWEHQDKDTHDGKKDYMTNIKSYRTLLHVFDLNIGQTGSWVSQKVEDEDPQVWILGLEGGDIIFITQLKWWLKRHLNRKVEIQKHACFSHNYKGDGNMSSMQENITAVGSKDMWSMATCRQSK